jgi:cyclophilin family peptidyl-prolyl cis-trans isomerase
MPSARKKQIVQAARKRQRRGRIYLVAIIIIITTIGIGWYVFASSQSAAPSNNSPSIVYAKLNTSQGTIEIELYQSLAPRTVENFVSVSNQGLYNNLVWHRIAKNFVIQTGDCNSRNGLNNSTWGQGACSPAVPFEYDSSLHNAVGYVAMASTAPKAGGTSQFYINIHDNSAQLDGNYAVFGKVISGMNYAYAIGNLPIYPGPNGPNDGQPMNPSDAMLISITISNTP